MHGVVGQAEARLEAFRRQVGGFRGMAGTDHAFGDARGEGVGERARMVMGDDDQGMHGRFLRELREGGQVDSLGKTYLL